MRYVDRVGGTRATGARPRSREVGRDHGRYRKGEAHGEIAKSYAVSGMTIDRLVARDG